MFPTPPVAPRAALPPSSITPAARPPAPMPAVGAPRLPCLLLLLAAVGAEAVAQEVKSPRHAHAAIQQGPGEGDRGASEEMDEAADATPHDGPYKSPYELAFKAPLRELLFDAHGPRGSPHEQSSIPAGEWYSPHVRKQFGGWGVPAREFDCPAAVAGKPAPWRRERVVAAAARFIGYEYQHHHVPDWNPPADWPWNPCCARRQGRGVDCSNFSGWNYNWALGIHLNTDVHVQAERKTARSAHGEIHAEVIRRPEGKPAEWYATLCESLRPGDLLYIANTKRDHVTHVIMWVGDCGKSPDGTPLVIDSTGGRIKDSAGHAIPCGIHLRPFRKGSWYHTSFEHAHRWVK